MKLNHVQILCSRVENKKIVTSLLINELNDIGIDSAINWFDIWELTKELGLIEGQKEKSTKITNIGELFYSLRDDENNINNVQKRIIFEKCLWKNNNFNELNEFLNNFEIDNENWEMKLFDSTIREKRIVKKNNDVTILLETDVLERDKRHEMWLIQEKYIENFISRNVKKELSQDDYEENEKEMKIIGDKGEELAMKYEFKMLCKKNMVEQADKFEKINLSSDKSHIGKRNIWAGYDIESFLNKSSRDPDKCIEVKSRKGKHRSFYISDSEVKTGIQKIKERKKSYLIYFYFNLGNEEPEEPTKIIPFEKLDLKICKNCKKYFVDISKFF